MAICGVYEIVNLYDGRMTAYVGSSNDIAARWHTHRSRLRCGKHNNTHLQAAWNKYGEVAFEFTVIEIVDDVAELLQREQYWLDQYRASGRIYNIALDALAPMLGRHHTAEHRRKIGDSNRGKRRSPETCRKFSEAQKGRKLSEQHKRNISKALKGRRPPWAAIEAARKTNLGRPLSEAHRRKMSVRARRENLSEETLRKMSEAQKGKVPSAETRRKLSEALKGRVFSEETLEKMSVARSHDYPAFFNLITGECLPAGRNLKGLCRDRGLSQGDMWAVMHRKKRSCKGWILAENAGAAEMAGRVGKKMPYRARAYPAFVNVKTGQRIVAGWNFARMCREQGVGERSMGELLRGKIERYKGWMLASRVPNTLVKAM